MMRGSNLTVRITLVLFCAGLIGFQPGTAWSEEKPEGEEQVSASEHGISDEGTGTVIEELKLFSKAMQAMLEGYVDDLEARELLYKAVKGMLVDLDKYSEFIDRDRFELFQIHMKGEYAGIGCMLEMVEDMPSIKEIQPGSLAEKAGLHLSDRILEIDHVSMEGKPIADVSSLIRGEEGVPVLLTIWREETQEKFDVEIVREKIEISAVEDVRMVGRAVGYLRISNFQENTMVQLDLSLEELSGKGMEALIIDLRNNDGGLMKEAIELSERFLPEGKTIVSVKSKVGVQDGEHVSTGQHTIPDIPLVILVNRVSASSSEIFSAAMQDHGRATIVGEQSYGKASVQSVIPLDDATAMKLTTARYLSPKGRVIDGIGITPDEIVPLRPPGEDHGDPQLLKAMNILKKHL